MFLHLGSMRSYVSDCLYVRPCVCGIYGALRFFTFTLLLLSLSAQELKRTPEQNACLSWKSANVWLRLEISPVR